MHAQSTTRTPRKPYASIEQAMKFRGKSEVKRENAPAWECGCKPYVDILTVGRWHAFGRYIRKGESAAHRAGMRANVPLFCRCQLEGSEDCRAQQDEYVPDFGPSRTAPNDEPINWRVMSEGLGD